MTKFFKYATFIRVNCFDWQEYTLCGSSERARQVRALVRRRDRYYANENRRKMTGYVEKMQLSADERGIDISSDGNVEHVDYKRIEAIYHCRESLFVYVAGDRAYIIPDGAFTEGTAADFAAYAAKKCGKSVDNVSI